MFSQLGRGNWKSCAEGIIEGRDWAVNPWEIVSVDFLKRISPAISLLPPGRSTKTFPGDPPESAEIHARSATDLSFWNDATFDLAITDPPFGSLIHYSDLADFFFYWLRIALMSRYSTEFSGTSTPRVS
jgi:putative DNA methylase